MIPFYVRDRFIILNDKHSIDMRIKNKNSNKLHFCRHDTICFEIPLITKPLWIPFHMLQQPNTIFIFILREKLASHSLCESHMHIKLLFKILFWHNTSWMTFVWGAFLTHDLCLLFYTICMHVFCIKASKLHCTSHLMNGGIMALMSSPDIQINKASHRGVLVI